MENEKPTKGLFVDPALFPPSAATQAPQFTLSEVLPLLTAQHYRDYPWLGDAMHSPFMARAMRLRAHEMDERDGAKQTSEKETMRLFNQQFVTVNQGDPRYPDGSLNIIRASDIVKLFPPGEEERWPAGIFLTSNHARTRSSRDVADIISEMHTAIEHANKEKLALEAHPDTAESVAGKAIILAQVFTESSALHNGASLLGRIQERTRNDPDADPSVFPPIEQMTRRYLPTKHERRDAVPPAAINLAKLMLSCIVTEPERVHFGVPVTEAELETGRTIDRNHLPEDMLPAAVPFVLRHDAARILSKFPSGGYSKAGNTVTEAALWLRSELKGADHWTAQENGKPVRKEGSFFLVAEDPQAQHTRRMEDSDLKRLLSGLGILALNAGEIPLQQSHIDDGLTGRATISHEGDLISRHFDHRRTHRRDDPKIVVKGTRAQDGHSPHEALVAAPGIDTGYLVADPEARKSFRTRTSQLYPDRAAIREFEKTGQGHIANFRLSFRAGILREDIGRLGQELQTELQNRFHSRSGASPLKHETIQVRPTSETPAALIVHLPEDLLCRPDIAQEMQTVLRRFCDDRHITLPGYVLHDIERLVPIAPKTADSFAEKLGAARSADKSLITL